MSAGCQRCAELRTSLAASETARVNAEQRVLTLRDIVRETLPIVRVAAVRGLHIGLNEGYVKKVRGRVEGAIRRA